MFLKPFAKCHPTSALRVARQVVKTSFVLNVLKKFSSEVQIHVNLNYASSKKIGGILYYGRDFFGSTPEGDEFIENLSRVTRGQASPVLVFVDDADRHPLCMKSVPLTWAVGIDFAPTKPAQNT